MGKKVSPISLRLGITDTWKSRWFGRRDYAGNLLQDFRLRRFVRENLKSAAVAEVLIDRRSGATEVIVKSAKPGIIVGRGGEKVGQWQKALREKFGDDQIQLSIQEVRNPEANAQLIAQNIAEQITKRFPHRRVCKMAVEKAKATGIKGLKIKVSGRLNGVDIARNETYGHGTVPLHTLRAKIDYASVGAPTSYGMIGVKVWVYHGLVFKKNESEIISA